MALQEPELLKRQGNLGLPNQVLSFRQWCELNGFSEATGRRIIKRGEGPTVLQLSTRRIGVRMSDNLAWQQTRLRAAAPTEAL